MKNAKMKAYRNRVWDEIEHFNAFSLSTIPHEQNSKAECLLIPHPEFNRDVYIVETIYKPSVPDNDKN